DLVGKKLAVDFRIAEPRNALKGNGEDGASRASLLGQGNDPGQSAADSSASTSLGQLVDDEPASAVIGVGEVERQVAGPLEDAAVDRIDSGAPGFVVAKHQNPIVRHPISQRKRFDRR